MSPDNKPDPASKSTQPTPMEKVIAVRQIDGQHQCLIEINGQKLLEITRVLDTDRPEANGKQARQ